MGWSTRTHRRVRVAAVLAAALACTGTVAAAGRADEGPAVPVAVAAPVPTGSAPGPERPAAVVSASPTTTAAGAAGRAPVQVDVTAGPVEVSVGLGGDPDASPARCGRLDRPETGVQGDVPLVDQLTGRAALGYSCGLSLVGANDLGGRGGNGNLAWVDDCAYATGDGIAVLDVADPTAPRLVTTLHGPGSDATIETIATVVTPTRKLLAAGRYGLVTDFSLTDRAPIDLYDVSDCRRPRLLRTFHLPGAVHNLTFSPDGTRLWSTLPLQAADVSNPRSPRALGRLEDDLRAVGLQHLQYAHEVWPSPDGRLLYLGGQIVGDEAFHVVDVSGWPERLPRVLGTAAGPGHSIRTAGIDGRRYVVRSDESIVAPTANSCVPDLTPFGGVTEPRLTDVTDPTRPTDVGRLELAINRPEHCLDALASGVDASVHYHDVDDPEDTTFVLASMWHAGLRVFDVRDPARPAEVAYFNPGAAGLGLPDPAQGVAAAVDALGLLGRGLDMAWGHVRYVPETGHVWLLTRAGGFWVLELQPQVRAALGLPPVPVRHPEGGPVRPGGAPAPARGALAGSGAPLLYCTLGRPLV